jgi:hypothetical protein
MPFTVMAVPDDNVQAVLDLLKHLAEEESDVSGYMHVRGGIGGVVNGSNLSNKPTPLGTSCVATDYGNDWFCPDTCTE